MKNRFIFTIISLLLFTTSAFCQKDFRKGFIVTPEGDTIEGQIDYRSNSKNYQSCIFKGKQGNVKYLPSEIRGFGYENDKYFSSQIIKKSFVEVLVIGELSLYKSKHKYHLKKDTNLYDLEYKTSIIKKDGDYITKEDNRWRGIVTYLIRDCKKISNSVVANLKFREKHLTRLIVKYNNCRGVEVTEFKDSKPWTNLELGGSVGLTHSRIQPNDKPRSFSYLDDSYKSIDPSLGITMVISSPRITEKMAFQSEVYFIKSQYSSSVKLVGKTTEYHETFIDLNTLSIPLSLKYSLNVKNQEIYLQGGINYDYNMSSDARLLSEKIRDGVVDLYPERTAFKINDIQVGYWGGIGVIKSFFKFRGSIGIRFFQMSPLNKSPGYANLDAIGFTIDNSRLSVNLILFMK